MSIKTFMGNNSDALLQFGAGLLAGRTAPEQLGLGVSGFAQARKDGKTRNATMEWLRANNPEIGSLVETGAISPTDAVKMAWQQKLESEKPKSLDEFSQRANAASMYGLDPNSEQGRAFILSGNYGGGGGKVDEFTQRQQAAAQFGLAPDNPAYQSFVLTGKMPREDQAPLTATDKKAILEADEMVQANQNAIENLKSIISGEPGQSLNDRAGSGMSAGWQAWAARNDPTGMFDDSKGEATTELNNVVVGNTLGQLKSIFGGNPTEGERAALRDLEASIDKTPTERKILINRAIQLAERRLEFNRQRANELRGGSYYKPAGSQGNVGKTSSGISFTVEP